MQQCVAYFCLWLASLPTICLLHLKWILFWACPPLHSGQAFRYKSSCRFQRPCGLSAAILHAGIVLNCYLSKQVAIDRHSRTGGNLILFSVIRNDIIFHGRQGCQPSANKNYIFIKLLKTSLRLPRRSLKQQFMEISPRRLVRKDGKNLPNSRCVYTKRYYLHHAKIN